MQIHRSIKCLDVYCENEKNGCKWIGQVEAIEKHLKECSYNSIPCEYQIIGCKTRIPRSLQIEYNQKDMKMHFNLVLGCVKELNDTKRQLQHANDKLIKSNNQLSYYQRNIQECEEKLKNANEALARFEQNRVKTLTKKRRETEWLIYLALISLFFNLVTLYIVIPVLTS